MGIVDDIAAGQHHTLGKAGRARRVLHIDHVVDTNRTAAPVEIAVGNRGRGRSQRLVRQVAGGRVAADVDEALQGGDGAAERTDLRQGADVVDITEPANRDERGRFALAEQIIDVFGSQRGIGGDEDRADLRQRKLQDDPLGDVGGPQHHPLAALHAARHQPARNRARLLFESLEREARSVRVHERLVVRQLAREPGQ